MLRIFIITVIALLQIQASANEVSVNQVSGNQVITNEPETDIYRALAQRLQSMQHASGDFEQRQFDEDDALLTRQLGNFSIAAPGKIRWQTTEPMAQLLISDGETYWLYDPDLEQVTVSRVAESIQQTPAALFSGEPQLLQQRYSLQQPDADLFTLKALDESDVFNRIDLTFDDQSVAVMVMWDRLGLRTEFLFQNVIIDQTIDDTLFAFVPPEHVDVVYQ